MKHGSKAQIFRKLHQHPNIWDRNNILDIIARIGGRQWLHEVNKVSAKLWY